jgi:hypothetical protein
MTKKQSKPVYGRIYLITNTVNGKVYVGKTIGELRRRWSQHIKVAKKGSPTHFSNAIRKYRSRLGGYKFLKPFRVVVIAALIKIL